ncbi:MAG: hypothetical protein ACO1NQ_09500 [Flavobacteriales bacterium]
MKQAPRILPVLLPAVLLMACSSMQPSTQVVDDVYFLPSQAPPVAALPKSAPVEQPVQQPTDDYYDPGTSQEYTTERSYYDLAYNDPYYYNMGRFGFNTAPMGWQTGWNGPGWGGGMGWGGSLGWGSGWGSGWNIGIGYGTGVYSGWYRPMWGWDPWGWNSPWGWNNWGWGGGWGYGNYYGPWGNCFGCYAPVIIADGFANSTYIGHRNSVGSGRGSAGSGVRRPAVRNPVGLAPQPQGRYTATAPVQRTTPDRGRQPITNPAPTRDRGVTPPRDRGRETSPSRNVDRSMPSRSPGFGGGDGGGRTSPSRDTGGGGTRTSPGRR